ncbi:MAG TPA: hypothetical protein VK457_09215 [Chloroflexota bacterium]|nr:hypothetical protein [Chloroflexota bacterium]
MSDVEYAEGGEDQRKANRQQRVVAAEAQPADEDLDQSQGLFPWLDLDGLA